MGNSCRLGEAIFDRIHRALRDRPGRHCLADKPFQQAHSQWHRIARGDKNPANVGFFEKRSGHSVP
jgi:hypothetical protein